MRLTPRDKTIGAFAIIIAASLWALDSALLRPRLYHQDPSVIVFLEHAIAFGLMAGFLWFERNELKELGPKDWSAFFWVALFGGAIGTLAITKAFFSVFLDGVSSVSVVVILQKTQPLFAILFAWVILKERPERKFFLWAGIALLGSYLAAFGLSLPSFDSKNPVFWVPLLSLLAAFAFGSSTAMSKRAVGKVSFRVATYLRFGLTALIMFGIVLGTGNLGGIGALVSADWLVIGIIVFTTGATAIFLYYYGLKRVMASKSTIYELAFPVVALAMDYFLHGTVLSGGQWLGASLLLFSMYMVRKA